MRKSYYSEYSQHCLRYYSRYRHPQFPTEADRLKWYACDNALKNFSPQERRLIMYIFGGTKPLEASVQSVAYEKNLPLDNMWQLIHDAEYSVARERGII